MNLAVLIVLRTTLSKQMIHKSVEVSKVPVLLLTLYILIGDYTLSQWKLCIFETTQFNAVSELIDLLKESGEPIIQRPIHKESLLLRYRNS